MVIAEFFEVKGSGWEVQIDTIVESSDAITVYVSDTPFFTAVMTQPFHIIKIPVTDKAIVFE